MEPDRDEKGLCQLVQPGETGQIVGKIRNDYLSRFEGYSDGDESRRKIIKNVFKAGDAAFISGDLLRLDENGWCYFVQRVADCYRINGENISSTMIEDHSKNSRLLEHVSTK
jgi:acyl-CoA synthetase (AMP-forming)/AMP-acid ligase II